MMNSHKFKLYDIILSLAEAIDLISPELNSHHQRVAYLSYRIAEQIGMPIKERREILLQGLLHDIGALSPDERISLLDEESEHMNRHAFRGAKLLSQCPPLAPLSDGIRYHHIPWNNGLGREYDGQPVPLASNILHLADRVSVYLNFSQNILPEISEMISKFHGDQKFSPILVKALDGLAKKEYIWLEMSDSEPLTFLPESAVILTDLDIDGVLSIAKIFSYVIDYRSRFTATHSAGVAHIAEMLASFAGMCGDECKMMLVAGYLHDLGKLAVKNAILEKPGKLNVREFSVIRGHTFYTYRLLNKIHGFSAINQWASFHHERLNGEGYPFHLKGEQIPLGSRIMTIADIFNAITEHRPYRKGMEKQDIINVFKELTEKGELCTNVVDILLDNLDLFIKLCYETQRKASEEYKSFFLPDDKDYVNAV